MIALDQYLISLINGNWLTITLGLGVLKIIAQLTPGVLDNKIHTLLSGIFSSARKPLNGGLPSMENRGEEIK